MTDDFKNAIANQFPVASGPAAPAAKVPPPLPRKAPPPLPPKKPVVDPVASLTTMQPATDAADRLRAIAAQMPGWTENVEPVIEKGYCNPPDSPAVLAATPEEAARVQGIEPPKAPEADELDVMTKSQLVELAATLGAEFAKGAREAGIRKAIRAKRAELAAIGAEAAAMPLLDLPAGLKEPPTVSLEQKEARLRLLAAADPTPPEVLDAIRQELLNGNSEHHYLADKAIEAVKLELPTEPAARQEALDAIAEESRRGGHVYVEMSQEDAQATLDVFNKIEAAQRAEQEMKIVSTSIGMLFVNCDIVGFGTCGRVLSQAEMVRKGNMMIHAESGVEDYRLVEFGKGAGYLALAVKSAIEDGLFGRFEAAAIDTRTPEGQTLYSTLAAMAGFIVRAV